MVSDNSCEFESQKEERLPSLLALRCFEAAARHENFSRAGEELHLTHGAISRAVRLLEDELDTRLFERRNRGVFLTEAGQRLAQAVESGLGLMRSAVSELRAAGRQKKRWVLSCEPTLLMRWLIPRWQDFQSRYPDVDVHLVAGGGPFSFTNGIDLAIRRNDFPLPAGFHTHVLFNERIGPVCRPDKEEDWFTPASEKTVLKKDAPRLHTRTRLQAWEEWAAVSQQPEPEATEQTFEHFYFSLQGAMAGLGVAIGPWHLVCDDVANGLLSAPRGFIEDGSTYCLISPKPIEPLSFEAELLRWLQNQA
ncbi:LysR family transcriptional regulator [Pokkaliibacter sp. CJK22405]|uniref:LysR family transcriptional regulator n=1 Tax=Pokkaliibacter sp. CJK22405 TaxID=3384615 RepID=UPI0039854139